MLKWDVNKGVSQVIPVILSEFQGLEINYSEKDIFYELDFSFASSRICDNPKSYN